VSFGPMVQRRLADWLRRHGVSREGILAGALSGFRCLVSLALLVVLDSRFFLGGTLSMWFWVGLEMEARRYGGGNGAL